MQNSGCRPLSDSELDMMLAGCQGRYHLRDRALLVLGAYTGFRIGELLAITVADIWDGRDVTRTVTVKAQFMKGGKHGRTLPVHERARDALREWIQAMHVLGMCSPTQSLFPRQRRNCALTSHQARRIILAAAFKAGISSYRIANHSLRKTFARRLWDSPLIQKDPARMARLLGHSNWSNTLRYLQFTDLEAAILA